jgi:hypothetical protein
MLGFVAEEQLAVLEADAGDPQSVTPAVLAMSLQT